VTPLFVEKARIKHGHKYDYSGDDYINNSTKVSILCRCGYVFRQKPNTHLNGFGCPKMCRDHQAADQQFIEKACLIHHNKYDYSKVEHKNCHTKVTIVCKRNGDFRQTCDVHLLGCGCTKMLDVKRRDYC